MVKPCDSKVVVKETKRAENKPDAINRPIYDSIGDDVFIRTQEDDKVGLSIEDKLFLEKMKTDLSKNELGNWEAPLPFKEHRQRLPNNRPMAFHRATIFDANLRRNPIKRDHFIAFMQKLFDNKHAELAPPVKPDEEVWYLPVFGVYHPRKKDQIRGVFDSSAIFNGTSLNDVLLSGPDLNNSILSVLLKFRMESIAVTADIQQMFHCFYVRPDHRNFLRFFWHRNNQFDQEIVEYRMKVHVFGNRPSPAVAVYGLHQTAISAEETFGTDVKDFVMNHFYVDDGLISLPSPEEATDLMKRTQEALQVHGNLRLQKFASSCKDVMTALPANDLHKDLKDLELSSDELPLQRSLGLYWNINTDVFTFRISHEAKPLTRRGVPSVINSIYDPLGFATPVVITGKLILRKLTLGTIEWDEPLSEIHRNSWDIWRQSLSDLENIQIPRVYVPQGLTGSLRNELHVYCDASEFEAIRGKVKIYRSDRGTNFVGSTDDLKFDAVNVEDGAIKQHMYNTGTEWIFNPPRASHFGGVWERMIGTIRRVLNSMLSEHKTDLSHDILCTFMAEVSAIVNARPLVAVSSDPDVPFILSPNQLLTQKLLNSFEATDLGTFSFKDMINYQNGKERKGWPTNFGNVGERNISKL